MCCNDIFIKFFNLIFNVMDVVGIFEKITNAEFKIGLINSYIPITINV